MHIMNLSTADSNVGSVFANVSLAGVKPASERRLRKSRDPICQVPGCGCDVSDLKEYHNRFRICEKHQRADCIVLDGIEQRFCQQCGRFQPLPDFDGSKRTCRIKLQQHNERRRISKYEKLVKSSSGALMSSPLLQSIQDRKFPECFDAFGSTSSDSLDAFEQFLTQPGRAHNSRNTANANIQALRAAQADTAHSRHMPDISKLQVPQARKPLSMSSSSSSTSYQPTFPNSTSSMPSSPPSYSSRSGSPQQTIFSASARIGRRNSALSGNSIPSPNISVNSSETYRSPSPPSSFPFPLPLSRKPSLQARVSSPPTNSLLPRPNPPMLPLSHRSSQLPDVDLPAFSYEDVSGAHNMYNINDYPEDSIFSSMDDSGPFPPDLQSGRNNHSPLLSALNMLVSSGLYSEQEARDLLVDLSRRVYSRNVEQLDGEQLQELVCGMMACGSRQMELDSSYDSNGMVPMNTSLDPFQGAFRS